MEHGDNRERCVCAVGYPVSPCLNPGDTGPLDAVTLIGAGSREPGCGISRDLLPRLLQGQGKIDDGLGPLLPHIMSAECDDLPLGTWGEDGAGHRPGAEPDFLGSAAVTPSCAAAS